MLPALPPPLTERSGGSRLASTALRASFIEAEGAYWHGTDLHVTFTPLKEPVQEATAVQFAPKGHLLAVGTRGGGLLIFHCEPRAALTLIRRMPRVACDAPNPMLSVRWSFDSAEVLTADDLP